MYRMCWFCCRSPAVRGQVRSYGKREIPDKRSVARSAHTTRFCPNGVSGLVRDGLRSGTKTGQPGCIWCTEAAGFCCRFPAVRGQVRSYRKREIPDKRSVARSAHTTRFCPKGVSGLVRDGLRSGTKTGQPGCIWCTEAAGFCCRFPAVRGQVRSYEKREIADKQSVARSHTTRFCPKGDRVEVEGQALYPSHTTGRAVFRIRRLDCSALR